MKANDTTSKAGQVNCALWENDAMVNGRQISMLKATIERRYRDKNDSWQSSNSFGRNEIPLAIYCLERAFQATVRRMSEVLKGGPAGPLFFHASAYPGGRNGQKTIAK